MDNKTFLRQIRNQEKHWWFQARKKIIDDFYVDLKLERSYNSLDTLKIYNNLINSFPEQESPTGVVFGRLTAIQKIKFELNAEAEDSESAYLNIDNSDDFIGKGKIVDIVLIRKNKAK